MVKSVPKIPKVGIKTIDGQYLSTEAYHGLPNKPQPIGIYVTDYTHIVVIHPTARTRNQYSSNNAIPNCFMSSVMKDAEQDFAGEANTLATIQAKNDGVLSMAPLAIWAQNQIFLDGQKGHIQSVGEFLMMSSNFNAINAALEEISGVKFNTSDSHCTSSQYNSQRIWRTVFGSAPSNAAKNGYYYCFPVYQEPYAL